MEAAHESAHEEGVDPGSRLFLSLCRKHWPIQVLFLKNKPLGMFSLS